MSNGEKFDAPDADIILRALGPPKRDFRVHKLILSLASPVFKDMFSLPQPDEPTSDESSVAKIEIVEVADPAHALYIVLRVIYPFTPPSYGGNLDTLVECLVIADKYEIKGAMSQLRSALLQSDVSQSLRVYAIASRFGFANLAESASRLILSSVRLTKIPKLPNDFEFVSATAYHQLVRQRASYLEVAVEIIKQTPLKSRCYNCPGGKSMAEEVFRLRLTHLIMTGTPVEVNACSEAWVKAYGNNAECEEDHVLKFICIAISRVDKGLVKPLMSPPRKSALKKT